jgi:hypothetical protein
VAGVLINDGVEYPINDNDKSKPPKQKPFWINKNMIRANKRRSLVSIPSHQCSPQSNEQMLTTALKDFQFFPESKEE